MNGVSGAIIPFDDWRVTPENKITLICAGEKDMAVARSHGFNAITITGGEMMVPRILEPFRNRTVVFVYDNDATGSKGAREVANALYEYTHKIKVCEGFHEVCCEPKEDITDFFNKYHKTKADLIAYIERTEWYKPELCETAELPVLTLAEAAQPEHVKTLVRSNIQIVAVTDTVFTVPLHATEEIS